MIWRKKADEPTPRVDTDNPPVPVLSDGEVLYAQDNTTYLPIKVVAYVTETAASRRAEVASWASDEYLSKRTFSDEMIYKQPNGRWITSSREFMATSLEEQIEKSRAYLAERYARLNRIRSEIDTIEKVGF